MIGLDYGLRRIGIAISDPSGKIALAVTTHVVGRDGSVLQLLGDLARDRGAEGVVLGLPLTADGRETEMAQRVRRFADRLHQALDLPITLLDERYTSKAAEQIIGMRGKPARRGEVDVVAAQIILQDHLDRVQRGVGEDPA